jgi:uncharacterized repeat protein (TIGR01451 family)
MKNPASKFCGAALVVVLALLGLAGPTPAKSLYLIASQDSETSSRIQAYNIEANGTLTYQTTCTLASNGAVGLALDLASQTLFVSTELSGSLTVIDARTMTVLGAPIPAPGAYDPAGMVMDEKKQLLYAVDRGTDQLFVYVWDAEAKTLALQPGSPHTLAGVKDSANPYSGAYGISLDKRNDILYVANATATIYLFHTSDWSPAGAITDPGSTSAGNPAISVAVDSPVHGSRDRMLYTGAGYAGDPYLKQYNLTTGAVNTVQITGTGGTIDGVLGLDVDENTGYVYVTTSFWTNELQAFNSALTKIQTPDLTGHPLNGPAGLVVGAGYNPMNLVKTAVPAYPSPVMAGDNVTYQISCDNLDNTDPVTNVIIRDNLPGETTFVSATGGGVYDAASHTVTWNLGTLAGSAPPRSFQLAARVKLDTPAKTIVNHATISSTESPSSTKSAPTVVITWGLAFPLPGYTSTTAPVAAVMDNAVLERTPIRFYQPSSVIKAFNGETGEYRYGHAYLDPYGNYWAAYKNSSGTDFFPPNAAGVRPLNYLNGAYLSYVGNPGYNYQVPAGTPVLATGDGRLYQAVTDPVNEAGYSYYYNSYIDHQNGYYSWYLYAPLNASILAQISQQGYAQVTKGQVIGRTLGDHLHFEVRFKGFDHANVVDPYKLGLWLSPTPMTKKAMPWLQMLLSD